VISLDSGDSFAPGTFPVNRDLRAMRRAHLAGRLLHECQQVRATKSALTAPADAKAGQQSIIRPPAERCFAHVQKVSCLSDVEQFGRISVLGIHAIPQCIAKTSSEHPCG
jgi:hypothetical protein